MNKKYIFCGWNDQGFCGGYVGRWDFLDLCSGEFWNLV